MANPRNRRRGGAPNQSGPQPARGGHGSHAAAQHGGGHGADEIIPDVTTPQGYQTYGVGLKHEERDTNVPEVLAWFGRLFAITAAVMVVVAVGQHQWQKYAESNDILPSPLFAVRADPPEPRVLPQPASDEQGPHTDLFYPWDLAKREHEAQAKQLQKLGLADEEGRSQLPMAAVVAVTGGNGGPIPTQATGSLRPQTVPDQPGADAGQTMPSKSSGGTATENRLR